VSGATAIGDLPCGANPVLLCAIKYLNNSII
jgi:hypothetical protein